MKNPLKTLTNDAPDFLSRFDSSTDMTLGLSSFHHGDVFKKVSAGGKAYSKIINALPASWRKKLYSYGGMIDATTYKDISAIDAEEISQWVYQVYPDQEYPAIAIGSSNGALSHLYAALGIPWLGQSFLVPIRKGEEQPVDKPEETIRWSEKQGATFLRNNPGWHLSQMMDPVQDRIRSGLIAYFRIKKQRLGKWYMKFIKERIQPGGTIFIADCNLQWPVINVGRNHTFQFGGLGTFRPEEFYHGSERITSFLKEVNAPVDRWKVPEPDAKAPEAEWGFDETLMDDILPLAKKEGYKVTRITFTHPQDISRNVAEMYRQWYRRNNQVSDRLLAESFTVHSPLLTLQTSAVPYWLFFNSEKAAGMMEQYLDTTEPFREMYMMILSHGKSLGGVTSIEHWNRTTDIFRLIESDIGRLFTDQATHLIYPDMFADTQKVQATLQPIQKEVFTNDNRWFRVRIMPYRTLDHKVDGLVVTFIDITHAKLQEGSLREYQSILHKFINEAQELVIGLSDQGKVIGFNTRAEQLMGYQREKVIGKDYLEVFVPEPEQPAVRKDLQDLLKEASTKKSRHPVKTAQGEKLLIEWSAHKLYDENGKYTTIINIGTNIFKP